MVYHGSAHRFHIISFELALNGALWYTSFEIKQGVRFVLNLPSTGHYGIQHPRGIAMVTSF